MTLIKKEIAWGFILFFLTGCSSKMPKSAEQKIKNYESRARTYQTLSDMQRLSPPYSTFSHKGIRSHLQNEHLRVAYLKEARRYRQLANQERKQLVSDSNESVQTAN